MYFIISCCLGNSQRKCASWASTSRWWEWTRRHHRRSEWLCWFEEFRSHSSIRNINRPTDNFTTTTSSTQPAPTTTRRAFHVCTAICISIGFVYFSTPSSPAPCTWRRYSSSGSRHGHNDSSTTYTIERGWICFYRTTWPWRANSLSEQCRSNGSFVG